MTTRSRRVWWLLWAAVGGAVAGAWLLLQPGYAGEPVTDEEITEMFKRSHNVMKGQSQRIHAILDGFFAGDLGAVQRHAEELAQSVDAASRLFPPQVGKEADQWEAMAELVRHAAQMKQEAGRGNYGAAYQHFSAMTYQCLKCHQVRRDWGTFPEPKLPDEKEADAKQQDRQTN